MRCLVLDIETSPNLAYVWDLFAKDGITPDKLVDVTEVLCFAWKWVGEKGVGFASKWVDGKDGMIAKAHELLDQADVVIHYNGKRFDIPHLNREFLAAGLTPPSPYEQVDLFLTAKGKFKFPSNRLSYISKALGVKVKGEAGGFSTWVGILNGDVKAQARMQRYNMRDVVVTEAVYHRLLPWTTHPSRVLDGSSDGCPTCKDGKLVRRGEYRSRTRRYQRFSCNRCGAWARSIKSEGGATVVGVSA